MGPHGTWFDFIPGIDAWKLQAKEKLGREWTWQVFQSTYFEITHVLIAALVVLLSGPRGHRLRRSVEQLGRRRPCCRRPQLRPAEPCSRGWPTSSSGCWRA